MRWVLLLSHSVWGRFLVRTIWLTGKAVLQMWTLYFCQHVCSPAVALGSLEWMFLSDNQAVKWVSIHLP